MDTNRRSEPAKAADSSLLMIRSWYYYFFILLIFFLTLPTVFFAVPLLLHRFRGPLTEIVAVSLP